MRDGTIREMVFVLLNQEPLIVVLDHILVGSKTGMHHCIFRRYTLCFIHIGVDFTNLMPGKKIKMYGITYHNYLHFLDQKICI